MAPLLYYIKFYASFHSHQWIQTGDTVWKRSIRVKIGDFFVPSDLQIWRLTSKNSSEPLVCCFKFCASFQNHERIQTGVTVQKHPIWVKIGEFLSSATLKFDGWPWKTIGYLFYAVSSFLHHFIAISEFKLELQSGNAQFGSKSAIFLSRVTLKYDAWPWESVGHLFYAASGFVHHFIAISEFKQELRSGNPQFGSKFGGFLSRVTLKFDGWPWKTISHLLRVSFCCFKLCASFQSHGWIQTGVTVRKRPIWVKIDDFLAVWPWN